MDCRHGPEQQRRPLSAMSTHHVLGNGLISPGSVCSGSESGIQPSCLLLFSHWFLADIRTCPWNFFHVTNTCFAVDRQRSD